eukprot:637568-Amphidinium_carterae.1
MRIYGTLAMLPNSATTWKGRCEFLKATTVRSTHKWRQRWQVWELRIGTLAMLPSSATTRKERCEYRKATTARSTP